MIRSSIFRNKLERRVVPLCCWYIRHVCKSWLRQQILRISRCFDCKNEPYGIRCCLKCKKDVVEHQTHCGKYIFSKFVSPTPHLLMQFVESACRM
ncbi:hypothetical protein PFISCL1PPCAC_18427, partial [Pristionchus fissidentatus]